MEKDFSHRLAWLAGIVDGEGSICMWTGFRNRKGHEQKKVSVSFRVSVTNTDPGMLAEIMAIADCLGVGYTYRPEIAASRTQFGKRPLGIVFFDGKDRCDRVLRPLLPFLITKQNQAILMLRAIEHRRTMLKAYVTRAISDDPTIVDYIEQVRAMNRPNDYPKAEED